jgi:hypothetical protein
MRIWIWLFGLIASGSLTGVVVFAILERSNEPSQALGTVIGALGGTCTFACARLWMVERRQEKHEE